MAKEATWENSVGKPNLGFQEAKYVGNMYNIQLSESPGSKVSINTQGHLTSVDAHWFEFSATLIQLVDEAEGIFLGLPLLQG